MKYSFLYPFLHWLLTLILSPFIVMLISESPYLNNIGAVFFMMFFGLLYSIPTFVIFIIEFILLKKFKVNPIIVKISMIFTALIGMAVTILILFDRDELVIVVAYGIIINVLGLLLPLCRKKNRLKN